MKKTSIALAIAALFAFHHGAHAGPEGGKVVAGQASIAQKGGATTIEQTSPRAIINWNSFNIGAGERVQHDMPGADSHGLYRVTGGGGASQLAGELRSNGNIYIVNPAGVVINKGAKIDVGGFLATPNNIADENFMAGKLRFDQPGQPGAAVVNLGRISVRDSGFAALVAPAVRNDGIIAARLGRVALASGGAYTLDLHGDELIAFTAPEAVVNGLDGANGEPLGVSNGGRIEAEGGVVLLTASQLDGIVKSVINNGGTVSAASAELEGGRIVFKGQGANVDVLNTGAVTASSQNGDGGGIRMTADGHVASSGTVEATGGGKGGSVVLTGLETALTEQARIDVSGAQGGGTVLVGGNALGQGPEKNAEHTRIGKDAVIAADATASGNGGQVVVWGGQSAVFDGTISARGGAQGGDGGKVETSGAALKVGATARVDTSAAAGKFGEWLLDPTDFTVAASGGDMTGATLSANLGNNNVVIHISMGTAAQMGIFSSTTP